MVSSSANDYRTAFDKPANKNIDFVACSMLMMSSPYTNFNASLKAFLRELDRTFPNNMTFKALIAGYKILKTMGKKLPQQYFYDLFCKQHSDCIRRRDDSSIFDPSYTPPLLYAGIINDLKNTWVSLDPVTKNTIWDHIIVLIALNDVCEAAKHKDTEA